MMEKLVLVHLSDIHFTGSSGTSIHDLDADVRNELLRDAATLTKELGGATGVLVTGDIAFSGKREQYERAASWLVDFCKAIDGQDESVWVVPGNHDVDRDRAKKVTKTLHESIRKKDEASIDAELREILSDPQSASALLEPLAEYNAFAARFECTITREKPFWERDLTLSCGTIIRLRGLCSALVCNANDTKGNIVLGTAQASVPRIDGVEYLTLCHHPPDWFRDQDAVTTQLESKVRIQLFGHKHAQRVQEINKTLRVTAGAMHPERNDRDWEPMYNVIEISRLDDQRLGGWCFSRPRRYLWSSSSAPNRCLWWSLIKKHQPPRGSAVPAAMAQDGPALRRRPGQQHREASSRLRLAGLPAPGTQGATRCRGSQGDSSRARALGHRRREDDGEGQRCHASSEP
jgi:predicted phosphodiesterase